MRSFLTALALSIGTLFTYANDGAYRVNGNQLIPMYETDISVKKEILSIRRLNDKQAEVDVYYEFFNPKDAKYLEVGFEAFSPYGDVDARPVNGTHPYITRFSVSMNDSLVPFKVTIVGDSLYFKNGKYITKPMKEVLKESEEDEKVNFFYVYHFRVQFKKGLNIIHHIYTVDLSNSVSENYSFEYVLSAAGRWANRQIDDFTLKIDMGEFQDLSIERSFFKNPSDWKILGTGKQITRKSRNMDSDDGREEFFIRKGMLIFQKKDFKPVKELYLNSYNSYYDRSTDENNPHDGFDSKLDALPFSIEVQDEIDKPANELSKRILLNLPFARRGYVFKSAELKSYYAAQKWYLSDPNYTADLNQLTASEKTWLKKLQHPDVESP